jgi:hypothetical protein
MDFREKYLPACIEDGILCTVNMKTAYVQFSCSSSISPVRVSDITFNLPFVSASQLESADTTNMGRSLVTISISWWCNIYMEEENLKRQLI